MTKAKAQMLLDTLILEDKVEGDMAKAVLMGVKALEEPEIVRCKDCKWYCKSDPGHPDCDFCKRLICGTIKPDFYCADGERKENK